MCGGVLTWYNNKMKQTDFERVMASIDKADRSVVITDIPEGKELQWHSSGPHMIYNHAGKHIETRGVKRG